MSEKGKKRFVEQDLESGERWDKEKRGLEERELSGCEGLEITVRNMKYEKTRVRTAETKLWKVEKKRDRQNTEEKQKKPVKSQAKEWGRIMNGRQKTQTQEWYNEITDDLIPVAVVVLMKA